MDEDENDPKQFRFLQECEEEVLAKISELKDLLVDASDEGERAQEAGLLCSLGIAYFKISDFQRARQYHEKHLALSTELEDTKGIGQAHCNIGCVDKALEDLESAKEHFSTAIEVAQESGNKRALARIYNNLGNVHEMQNEMAEALDCHQKRLALAHDMKDTNGIGKACASLGNICHVMGDLDASIRYYQEMLKILREKLRIQDTLAEESEDSGDEEFVDLDMLTLEAMEEVKKNMREEEQRKRIEALGLEKPKFKLKKLFKKKPAGKEDGKEQKDNKKDKKDKKKGKQEKSKKKK